MHIIGLVAENYKKLRIVEITPKGRVVQLTGKNGAGKTSVLDAVWTGLVGARATPDKPVRKGAEKARIKLNLGTFVVTRTISPQGQQTLTVENDKGVRVSSPQAILDELMGELTFDPLAFVGMKPKDQIDMLRQVAKLEIDIDDLNAKNKADYDARTEINRDVKRLEVEVAGVTVQDGLPKEKLNEKEVLDRMAAAGAENARAQEIFKAKQNLQQTVSNLQRDHANADMYVTNYTRNVEDLEKKLEGARKQLQDAELLRSEYATKIDVAQKAYDEAPEGKVIDVADLTAELQRVQLTNREIDKRQKREALEKQLHTKRHEADQFSRQIETREEQKRTALQNAKMPVEGLTFDESQVMFNGIPLEQLGEAEQIRISTSIAMAANPKLRILRVLHGEALDDDSMKILEEMAEANDFQIWMAKVDSSGKVGIVMEDGMVKETAAAETV